MLRQLIIDHVALIEHLEMAFPAGFTVLTGETGAGKSIIIEALNFVLGERASRELIQSGAPKASVEALFSVEENDLVLRVVAENELSLEDGELTLSRELTASGKNTCRINGTLVSAAVLKAAGDALVDIHGQHAHQSLLSAQNHLSFLDAFSGQETAALRLKTQDAYHTFSKAKKRLLEMEGNERDRDRRLDLLSYQIKEIDKAQLIPGEEEELLERRQMLQNSQLIMESLDAAVEMLSGETGALTSLSGALHALDTITGYHKESTEPAERLRDSYYTVEDVAMAIRDLRSDFSYEPDSLDSVEWRLETISTLKRKYGDDIPAILAYRDKIGEEYDILENSEARKEELQAAYVDAEKDYMDLAQLLSKRRQEAAKHLSDSLIPEFSDLGMPGTQFETLMTQAAPAASGIDTVEFLISTNRGEPVKPLAKVASGGEISRIMLAFKTVMAGGDGIQTMVFDEIDTGISGLVGNAVAKKMLQISKMRQVLCITHLPQIAACADAQFFVFKESLDGRTCSSALRLDDEGRYRELARIMGSEPGDPIALRHAKQLIQTARHNS